MYAHQRYDEFAPKAYFQSVQAGARINGGARDALQMHRYQIGEFGPGGLYHNTAGAPGFDGTTKGMDIRMHPKMPVQNTNSVWTFDGTLPPKLLMARYGEPILFRHYNGLPIDVAANNGFGNHTITTHEHNGHNPAESDGFTGAYFYPGQFYDYRWPMQLAGHDSINTDASDPRAGMPDGAGGDDEDPRRLARDDEHALVPRPHDRLHRPERLQGQRRDDELLQRHRPRPRRLQVPLSNPTTSTCACPAAPALDWGNRDYDVNLVIADKAWDSERPAVLQHLQHGRLPRRPDDRQLAVEAVHGCARAQIPLPHPERQRVALHEDGAGRPRTGARVPFYMIANDGNIMEHAVPFPNAESQDLPTQAHRRALRHRGGLQPVPAGHEALLRQHAGAPRRQGPEGRDPARRTSSRANTRATLPSASSWSSASQAYAGPDLSMNPADYVEGKKKMIPRAVSGRRSCQRAHGVHSSSAASGGTDEAPWTIKTDGG